VLSTIAAFPLGLLFAHFVFGESWNSSISGGFAASLASALTGVLQWFDQVRAELRSRRDTP
jgi:hypothetical protein